MALVDSRPQRVCMLCAMYFAQGVPWGFMVTALMSYLAQRGVEDADLGELTAVVLVPWTFKLVWGPLIDTMTIRSMGRRRPWIIGAELMMAISLLGMLMLGDLSNNLRMLGWMFFIHNCFASLQDVATDALAVDILPANEQGKMNGMMWGSKLIGKAIGASAMAVVISSWGLPAAVLAQFIILLIIMLFPIVLLERPGEKRFPWSKIGPQEPVAKSGSVKTDDGTSSLRSPIDVLKDLIQAFSLVTTSVFFFYGVVHVIGWGIVEVITKPLYTQQLGWNYVQISSVSGAAVFPEIFGALLGGFLADRFGRRKVIAAGFGMYGLLAAVFAMSPGLWDQWWFAGGYLFLNPCFLAMGAVGFLSMGMRIAWTKAAATMFTIYMTMSNVGHVLGNSWVGTLRDTWGLSYEQTFWVAALVTWLPLLLLPFVNPERVPASLAAAKSP
jgi:PAT family beta-lactamase induction signal transducer AmpG